jgi:20S proteasome alpha/beta subunit
MLKHLMLYTIAITLMHKSVTAQRLPEGTHTETVQGSVDVIISTKEGFVLATDSRLTTKTDSGTRYGDDAQKLFRVGTQTACVVAGLQSSKAGSGILRPANAIGTTLLALDRSALTSPITAENAATSFYLGIKQIAELGNWPRSEVPQTGELSVVSVTPEGTSDWISLSVPLKATGRSSEVQLSAGSPTYSIRGTGRPLHFAFDVIGQRAIVDRMLQADGPERDKHTQSSIMVRYYRQKRAGQLDRFTLAEAIMLARELVQATIDLAPESAGVGGPIDIATITKNGFHCIQRKCRFASLPTPLIRVTNSTFGASPLVLDNLQCINCNFTDSHLLFDGTADVQLYACKFGGKCRLVITPKAKRRSPDRVEALQELVGHQCIQVEQQSNYP